MADISKIKTPDGTEYNVKDTTARSGLSGKQATITASGVLIGNGSGGVTAKTLDTSSLTNDNNHVPTSGVVKSAISAVLPAVTATDNGKVLMVVNGAWAKASLPVYNGGVS